MLSSKIVTEEAESATLVVCDVKCWGTIYEFQLELQDKIYMDAPQGGAGVTLGVPIDFSW